MMNLTELKKMLQKDFNVKYLSDLEQIELVQNNEDLHIGIVKVELKVAYKYYTIGTFGVLNKNAKVDGRKIKASMTYLNKIATWFADVQEVDVKIFIDDEYQTTKKVKQVELLTIQEPTQAIEKVACEVEEKQVFTQEPLPYKEWCELEFKKWHNEFELLIKGMLETLDGELCNISYSDVFGISINYFWNETTVSKIKETKDFIINTFHAKYTDYLASSLIPLLSEYRDDSLLQISEISRQLFVNVVDLCEEIGFNDMESFTSEEHYKEYLNNFNTSN